MRIECKTTFLDGTRRFEAGDIVTVPDEDAAHFIAQGWAATPGEDQQGAGPQTGARLIVDNITHRKGARHG